MEKTTRMREREASALFGSADLRSANLWSANLRSANLGGADLGGAECDRFTVPPAGWVVNTLTWGLEVRS